ncbi:hypothetical protein POM88_021407 [Heracleum sosnowskyi]|uniref:Helitron helicase-like domain-containing protein n=1 Tax=Heracleum sosnowskyi TaxID=360622 RepID=A0AAD8MSR2_9APIA|nr:hypothetical protein POM88_021407 [Heracleum sosnowskyi]
METTHDKRDEKREEQELKKIHHELLEAHDELRRPGSVFEEIDNLHDEHRQECRNSRQKYLIDCECNDKCSEEYMECNKKRQQDDEEQIIARNSMLDIIAEERRIEHNEKRQEKYKQRKLHTGIQCDSTKNIEERNKKRRQNYQDERQAETIEQREEHNAKRRQTYQKKTQAEMVEQREERNAMRRKTYQKKTQAEMVEQREERNAMRRKTYQKKNVVPNLVFDASKLIVRPTLQFQDLPALSKNMRTRINKKKHEFALSDEILNIGFADKICCHCGAVMWRLQYREREGHTLIGGGRLFLQFVVDAWASIEHSRISWVLTNQSILRSDVYNNIVDSVNRGDVDATKIGKRIVLPSSFTGSPRYMQQNYQDCMAICRKYGSPDFFITFTCNPQWPEVKQYCEKIPHTNPANRPDVLARVFKIKLDLLLEDLTDNHVLGKVIGVAYTIEFQKRDGKCTKYFPKEFTNETTIDSNGYPVYRRRDDKRTIQLKDVSIDNRFIVPYNRGLIVKYQAHINIEWCNQGQLIKYMFKYVTKGPDKATLAIEKANDANSAELKSNTTTNEVDDYIACRYISSSEACWRIYGFSIHHHNPVIVKLVFHLESEQQVCFQENVPLPIILGRVNPIGTMFIQWFETNKEDPFGRELTYVQFPEKFLWNESEKIWNRRKNNIRVIGRLIYVHPTAGERFYLRILLNIVRGATSFEDVRKVNGVLYNTYKEACFHHGLLEDDDEWHDAIKDAAVHQTGSQLRELFVTLLLFCDVSDVRALWDLHWKTFSDDIELRQRRGSSMQNFVIGDKRLECLTLYDVDLQLRKRGQKIPYANWVIGVGNGQVPTLSSIEGNEPCWIEIPPELYVEPGDNGKKVVVDTIYYDLHKRYNEADYFKDRAILTPLNEDVNLINKEVLEQFPGESRVYRSVDSICKSTVNYESMESMYPPEYLNTIKVSGITKMH